jgi:hypothetical protein
VLKAVQENNNGASVSDAVDMFQVSFTEKQKSSYFSLSEVIL